jgi:hypothetical protein
MIMLFSFEYELAKEIQRDRLARAERARQLQMIKTTSTSIPKKWGWRFRLGWKATPKAVVIRTR